MLVEKEGSELSIARQCELLEIERSGVYYQPVGETELNLWLMKEIDRLYTAHPYFGSRRITVWLNAQHERSFNRKRIQALMRKMGIQGILPGPHTSKPQPENKVYPYLLRNVAIERPNQVWSAGAVARSAYGCRQHRTDITYVPMARGYMFLIAIIDWFSRYILAWELLNTQDSQFCLDALEVALSQGQPEIFNSDQGSQFTSQSFTQRLQQAEVQISMDGRGRCLDNIFIERFWRSVKYENIYVNEYESVRELQRGLRAYFEFYNTKRPHQSLDYKTPLEVHFSK